VKYPSKVNLADLPRTSVLISLLFHLLNNYSCLVKQHLESKHFQLQTYSDRSLLQEILQMAQSVFKTGLGVSTPEEFLQAGGLGKIQFVLAVVHEVKSLHKKLARRKENEAHLKHVRFTDSAKRDDKHQVVGIIRPDNFQAPSKRVRSPDPLSQRLPLNALDVSVQECVSNR